MSILMLPLLSSDPVMVHKGPSICYHCQGPHFTVIHGASLRKEQEKKGASPTEPSYSNTLLVHHGQKGQDIQLRIFSSKSKYMNTCKLLNNKSFLTANNFISSLGFREMLEILLWKPLPQSGWECLSGSQGLVLVPRSLSYVFLEV